MDFRILGPLEVEDDGQARPLGGAKQRALLVLLLAHANKVVSRDRLIDDLWGDHAPQTATSALQVYISELRKRLGAERILTRPPGYVLKVDPESLDLGRFERLAREGRTALADAQPQAATRLLSEALELWRGPPLSDLDSSPFAYAERLRLDELRLSAVEDRVEAELMLGNHRDVVSDLEALVSQHPYRERPRGQLMLALYRCGRHAEALDAYQKGRHLLVEELGLEPGASLRRLEQAVLNQDPTLDLSTASPASSRPRTRRPRWMLVALGGAVIAAATGAAVVLNGSDPAPTVVPNSLVKIDPTTNTVEGVIPVGRFPGKVIAGNGFVWVVNIQDETLTRVTPRTGNGELVGGLRIEEPTGMATDGRGLFVGSFANNEVVVIDPTTLDVKERIELPGSTAAFLASGAGSLWITQPPPGFDQTVPSSIARVSLLNNGFEQSFEAPAGVLPGQIAFGAGAAWVANVGDRSVWRIDSETNQLKQIQVGSQPTDVTVGFNSVWVPCIGSSAVWRLDARTGDVQAVIPTGDQPLAVAVGADAVWVTNQADGTLARIDPTTNSVVTTIRLGFNPHGVAVTDEGVWVAVADGLI